MSSQFVCGNLDQMHHKIGSNRQKSAGFQKQNENISGIYLEFNCINMIHALQVIKELILG